MSTKAKKAWLVRFWKSAALDGESFKAFVKRQAAYGCEDAIAWLAAKEAS